VLAGLVNRAALDNEAARLGLSVGDATVAAELGKISAFQGISGTFDREAYSLTLQQNGTNEAAFEANLRRDLARALLAGAVAGGVVSPAPLTDTLVAFAGEKRGFSLLVLDDTALDAPLAAPTPAEVQAHYDANIATYTRPEAKRIEYAALLPETIAATMEVPEDEAHRYGIVDPGASSGVLTEVKGFVEKPKAGTAPSRLAAVGRYLIEPECMTILAEGKRGAGGEIQLTDALAQLIGKQPFHAFTYAGARFDCGDKAGHVTANIALALERADIGPAVKAWLKANVN
jgi:hypothetical protein